PQPRRDFRIRIRGARQGRDRVGGAFLIDVEQRQKRHRAVRGLPVWRVAPRLERVFVKLETRGRAQRFRFIKSARERLRLNGGGPGGGGGGGRAGGGGGGGAARGGG